MNKENFCGIKKNTDTIIQTWSNVLLTSAGFEDMAGKSKPNITAYFRSMLDKPASDIKVLFIPTAAIDSEAKEMVIVCRNQLIHIGILPKNIITYQIDGHLTKNEAMTFDVIYFTGGNTEYLLQRIKETGFDSMIKTMVFANKIYIGVSAGSLIATPNIGSPHDEKTAGLHLANAYLSVHCSDGMPPRTDLPLPHFALTDNQALAVTCEGYHLING